MSLGSKHCRRLANRLVCWAIDHDWSWVYGIACGHEYPKCQRCGHNATREEAESIRIGTPESFTSRPRIGTRGRHARRSR